jgi:hypothetical protein
MGLTAPRTPMADVPLVARDWMAEIGLVAAASA